MLIFLEHTIHPPKEELIKGVTISQPLKRAPRDRIEIGVIEDENGPWIVEIMYESPTRMSDEDIIRRFHEYRQLPVPETTWNHLSKYGKGANELTALMSSNDDYRSPRGQVMVTSLRAWEDLGGLQCKAKPAQGIWVNCKPLGG